MQEIKTKHTFVYLACEPMVVGVRQLQIKNWVKQPKR